MPGTGEASCSPKAWSTAESSWLSPAFCEHIQIGFIEKPEHCQTLGTRAHGSPAKMEGRGRQNFIALSMKSQEYLHGIDFCLLKKAQLFPQPCCPDTAPGLRGSGGDMNE